jgi:transcriptional regulator with XRE-family HTH domain
VSDVQTRFGQRLRELRTGKGISQETLAESAGLHRTYVSSVERGERNVTLTTIEKLAAALGVPMTELIPSGPDSRRSGKSSRGLQE